MAIVRYLIATAIVLVSVFCAIVVLLFSWLPKGGAYPFMSHRVFGPWLIKLTGSTWEGRNLDVLQAYDGKAIFVANHQSHFDIPAIMSCLEIPMYFVAKKELKHIPIFGWGMWSCGMIFVDRSNREKSLASMKKAAKTIQKGKAVLSFPEGTRSKTGKIHKFKKGAFHMAKEGNLQVIPISIVGTRDIMAPGGNLGKGHAIVSICEPISPAEVEASTTQELADLAQKRITEETERNLNS